MSFPPRQRVFSPKGPELRVFRAVRRIMRMKHALVRPPSALSVLLLALVAPAALGAPPTTQPPADPAKVAISVSPQVVSAGGRAEVTVRLTPAAGIRINRYPKIKLDVPERAGLVRAAEGTVGDDSPPPIGDPEANYFEEVDPLTVAIDLDRAAKSGTHEIEGQLTYYYCVKKSGFCAPKKAQVRIALEVR